MLAAPATDFGIRVVGGASPAPVERPASTPSSRGEGVAPGAVLRPAAALGARWGRVTSTYRSPARNRAVGGVRNSWHLRGRAIDIARRPGVSHAAIAAAFRAAGYTLIESLDEGDHSHFAFGGARSSRPDSPALNAVAPAQQLASEMTDWGIVTVSTRRGRGRAGR